MTALADLQHTKDRIVALAREIDEQRDKFEASIRELVEQRGRLEREYADALRAELASLDAASPLAAIARRRRGVALDEEAVIGELRKSGMIELSANEIRSRLGLGDESKAALQRFLAVKVKAGEIEQIGQRRASKYRLPLGGR